MRLKKTKSLTHKNAATTERADFEENGFTGALPIELLRSPSIRFLRLYDNQFTGAIPTTVGLMSSLEKLELSSNALGGTLPTELFSLPNLSLLTVDRCGMSGTLSEDFVKLNMTMRDLVLSNNGFTGPIPQAFDQLTILSKCFFLWRVSSLCLLLTHLQPISDTLILHGNALTGIISATLCAEKGDFFNDLRNLTAPILVSCTCCNLQQ